MKTPSVNQKCAWSLSTLAAVIGVAIATLTTSSLVAANTSNVNVVNTPNVNIANTPIVQDRDNPARQPFAYSAGPQNWIGNAPNISFDFTVPGGKRLVIEQVSVIAHLTASTTQKLSARVVILVSPFPFYRFVGTDAGQTDFVASSQMRCYADAGTSVTILVTRSDTSGGGANVASVSLSGYLIDIP